MKNLQKVSVIVTNMAVTFVQAALAVWVTSGFSTDKLAVSGAVGAGASAVWNVIIKPFLKNQGWLKKEA